jgi:O-antigen/teichoic acid export membrane protein
MAASATRRGHDSSGKTGVALEPDQRKLDSDVGSVARSLPTIQAVWHKHQDLLRNLLALLATTGLTSGLGFAYWDVAARLFSQEAVGYGTAAVSALTLASSIGVFGLGTLLIGDLPRRQNRAGLISAAMLAAAGGSLILALAFVLVIPHFTSNYDDVASPVSHASLFCIGVALTAMSIVFDSATIGMQRGTLQLVRNLAFVLFKLVTLIATATIIHASTGIGIFASWVAAIPLALMLVAVRLLFARAPVVTRPDWKTLRSLGRVLLAHNWLNLSLQVPSLITPVLVASILAPSINGAYYVAMTICMGLFILPMHLSTSLFALTSGDQTLIARKLRFAATVSLVVGIPIMVVLGVGAHFILSLFGAGYARAAALPMRLLVLTYLPTLPTSFYVSVSRATGRMSRAAAVMTTFAAFDVAAVVIGCMRFGLVGMTAAGLGVTTIEAFVTGPTVLKAALGSGRHRLGLAVVEASNVAMRRKLTVVQEDEGARVSAYQQQAGLSMLISMATPVTLTMPRIRWPEQERVAAQPRE